MNTEDLEKLYKKHQNDAAPDFWDRIDKELKPHSELSEEEKNAFAQFEELPSADTEKTEECPPAAGIETDRRTADGRVQKDDSEKVISLQDRQSASRESGSGRSGKTGRRHIGGWIAAAAVLIVCIPAALLLSRQTGGGRSSLAAADTEAMTEAAMEAAMEETTAAATMAAVPEAALEEAVLSAVPETVTETAAETAAAGAGILEASLPETLAAANAEKDVTEASVFYERSLDSAAPESGTPAAVLLSVPENAVTEAADTVYFTEDVLADTDLLAIVEIDTADFEYNEEGRAYRLSYSGTVKDSLLDDSESGAAGSSIRIVSPIVSSGTAVDEVLYQLVPGQTYILPLKKSSGDWELVCPYAPQIELHEDGSFEFHTGYSSLLNDDTEVVFDTDVSDDDFWFDRRVSRSDDEFLDELTELVKFKKKESSGGDNAESGNAWD